LCWGTFASGPPTEIQTPTAVDSNTWVGGSAGVFNACGILDTRAMACWGRNSEGQLGSNNFVENVPVTLVGLEFDWLSVVMGRFHTCAQKLDGRILCTGENADGQLGLGDMNRRSAMTQVTLP
jgi:alpha-tubulin suppressor-like RCC1 family protein